MAPGVNLLFRQAPGRAERAGTGPCCPVPARMRGVVRPPYVSAPAVVPGAARSSDDTTGARA